MKRLYIKIFATTFAIALSIMMMVFGIFYADVNTRTIGGQDGTLAFSVLSKDRAALSLFGTSYQISLTPYNAVVSTYKKAGQFYLDLFSIKPLIRSLKNLDESFKNNLIPKLTKYYEENIRIGYKRKNDFGGKIFM